MENSQNSRQGNINDQGSVDVTALTEEFKQLGGSGSGTCSTDGQPGEQVTITISDYLLERLKDWDDEIKPKKPDTQQNTKPHIQRVPFAWRSMEMTFYEPKVVGFGLIHHACGYKVKLKLAAQFTLENGIDRKAALIKIMNIIEDLQDCYEEDFVRWRKNESLAMIFLIDGCAMLHFMERVVSGREESLLQEDVNYDFIAFAKRDLFLLENQLPYQLLQLLTCSIDDQRRRLSTEQAIAEITHLVSPCIEILPVQTPRHDRSEGPTKDPHHLLDLLHRNMTISPVGNRVGCLMFHHDTQHHDTQHHDKQHHYMQATFRTAKELKSSGIMLKQSATSSMNGVSFHQGVFSGTLSLPSITVDDFSACILYNLIAYEMCPDFKNELEVTSYVCFLDSLIDQSEDVRELRQARILRNHLNSDEDVAKFFNKIGSLLVPNPTKYRYIKGQMYKQHKNMGIIRTWVAGVKETYFSNPWTFLAVCGAIFGLVLTFIQTWYAVKSYYDNPKF